MHDTPVNPPTGGRVVAGCDHPAAATTGVGTVVGTADGSVVVGAPVVGVTAVVEVVVAGRARAARGEPHAAVASMTASTVTAPARRPGAT
jgi:hypothetical protein